MDSGISRLQLALGLIGLVSYVGFLAFLSVLLRLWATAGELLLTGVAYVFDYRGAMNRPDAPGRKLLPPADPDVGPTVRTGLGT